MKKLNITKKQYDESKYFNQKYGAIKFVSESGKLYKTDKGVVIALESANEDADKDAEEPKDNEVDIGDNDVEVDGAEVKDVMKDVLVGVIDTVKDIAADKGIELPGEDEGDAFDDGEEDELDDLDDGELEIDEDSECKDGKCKNGKCKCECGAGKKSSFRESAARRARRAKILESLRRRARAKRVLESIRRRRLAKKVMEARKARSSRKVLESVRKRMLAKKVLESMRKRRAMKRIMESRKLRARRARLAK